MNLVIYTVILLSGYKTLVGPDVVKRGATMAMRRRAKNRSEEDVYGVPVPEGLHEAIETERDNLSKAESLLGCLAISLEYEADSVNKPYYPDVAQLARALVKQSINGLDSLVLQQRLLRNKIKESSGLACVEGAYPVFGSSFTHRLTLGVWE
jgi:hypothetical protein